MFFFLCYFYLILILIIFFSFIFFLLIFFFQGNRYKNLCLLFYKMALINRQCCVSCCHKREHKEGVERGKAVRVGSPTRLWAFECGDELCA